LNKKNYSKISTKTKAKILGDAVISDYILGGAEKECLFTQFRQVLRKITCAPHCILEVMDLSGSVLNYTGLKLLRKIDVSIGKYKRSIIPSMSKMVRCRKYVNSVANLKVPFSIHTINSTNN